MPAGEAANPRRHVPFALIATIIAVTAIMTLAQIVAMGTLPNLELSKTPLADASLVFIGAAGALLISAGSVVSMAGNNLGSVLTGSRMLFALAENGELPRFFGRSIHIPHASNAIVFTTVVALGLALTGHSSCWPSRVPLRGWSLTPVRVRRRSVASLPISRCGQAGDFVVPMGPLVPMLAIAVTC